MEHLDSLLEREVCLLLQGNWISEIRDMFPIELGSNPLFDHFLLKPGILSLSNQVSYSTIWDLDHPSDGGDIKKGS